MEEDSDSGEDFEYDEEDDEQDQVPYSKSAEQNKEENIDLMAFISNMDIPTNVSG